MGYLSQRGKVGQYKGKDVYVFELSDVEPWMKHTDHIFLAMIRPEGHHAQLVLDGIIVGEMDDAGCIKLYENGKRRAYVWDEEPVVKKKYPKKEKEEVKEVDLDKLALNVSNGYGQFSKVVDGFFAGLEKLWQEIDVEIQEQGNL